MPRNLHNSRRATPASRCPRRATTSTCWPATSSSTAAAADKVHGETIPFLAGHQVTLLREPHGVTGHILPWNYPAQMLGRTRGAGAGDGQRHRAEASRGYEPVGAALRRARQRRRLSRGRAERRHRPGRGSRRRARRTPGHRLRLFHRQQRGRHAGAAGRGEERRQVRAGTRRQVAADRVRRRRLRPRGADHRARDHPERRADLHRRQPAAGPALDLRHVRRPRRRGASRRCASVPRRWISTAAR